MIGHKVCHVTRRIVRDPYNLERFYELMLDKRVGSVKSIAIDTLAEQSVPDIVVAHQSVIAPAFDDLEFDAARSDLHRAEAALWADIDNLEAVTADYQFSTDTSFGRLRAEAGPIIDTAPTVIAARKTLSDIHGAQILVLRTQTPRNISSLGSQTINAAMLFLIVALGKAIKLDVVAEGVETEQLLTWVNGHEDTQSIKKRS